jgi:hypothetical protein
MRYSSLPSSFWLFLAGLWLLVTTLAHLEFSLWLVRERTSLGGSFSYKDYVPAVATLAGGALLLWLAYGIHKARWRSPVLLYWLVWGICVALVDGYLPPLACGYSLYLALCTQDVCFIQLILARLRRFPVLRELHQFRRMR